MILNGKDLYLIIADSKEDAKHWAINHLDMSKETVVREIETFKDVTSGISIDKAQ